VNRQEISLLIRAIEDARAIRIEEIDHSVWLLGHKCIVAIVEGLRLLQRKGEPD
jgi:hypothetical protein